MKKTEFDPGSVLGAGIAELDRQALCELVAELCRRIREETGTRAFRGGIYPENISMTPDGPVIGPASQGSWEGQELQFLPPELYWNGKQGSFSDVYSLGLLLYYGVSKGRLPYEGQCKDPQLRRMGGENFKAPKAAGRRLGEIIEKATRFNSEERYQNVEELQIMLEGTVKNLYLKDEPSAQAIFNKNDDDLNDFERMMVDIIEQGEEEPEPEEAEDGLSVPEEAAAGEPAGEAENVRVYEPVHSRQAPPVRQPIPILTEEKNPELAPVVPSRQELKPAVQYGKSAQREKQIAEQARRRRRKRPLVLLLVLLALLIVAAIIAKAWLDDLAGPNERPQDTPPVGDGIVVDPNGGIPDLSVPTAPPTESPAPTEEPKESWYEIIRADVSWTEAQARCAQLGGHLAVISSEEEYNTIVALAEGSGVTRLWIGLHREDGKNVWETDEEVSFYPWDVAAGEPSFVDVYDNVDEDYVMLWNNNGGWYYNDSRNDPISDYPQWYSGTVGFVCEYEGQ